MSNLISRFLNYLRCLTSNKCKFWYQCEVHQETGTCRSIDAEGGYCGRFHEYRKSASQPVNEDLKAQFLRIFTNLPLKKRKEIVCILDKWCPISWNVAWLEIKNETKLGQEILKRLKELNIIKDKMPIVNIYITPEELERVNSTLTMISQQFEKGEKPLEIRVKGRINYHDISLLLKEEYKKGYNQRLKDEGKVGEKHQHLYL